MSWVHHIRGHFVRRSCSRSWRSFLHRRLQPCKLDQFWVSLDFTKWLFHLTLDSFNAVSSDFEVAGGGVMYKLLMRAFPGWYQPNSVYALYPFVTPGKSRDIMERYMKLKDLDFNRPSNAPPPVPVTTWKGATKLLEELKRFHVPCKSMI